MNESIVVVAGRTADNCYKAIAALGMREASIDRNLGGDGASYACSRSSPAWMTLYMEVVGGDTLCWEMGCDILLHEEE